MNNHCRFFIPSRDSINQASLLNFAKRTSNLLMFCAVLWCICIRWLFSFSISIWDSGMESALGKEQIPKKKCVHSLQLFHFRCHSYVVRLSIISVEQKLVPTKECQHMDNSETGIFSIYCLISQGIAQLIEMHSKRLNWLSLAFAKSIIFIFIFECSVCSNHKLQ